MNTWPKVVRYHLLQRFNYLLLPVSWLAFAFAVDLIIFALIPVGHHGVLTGHGVVQVPDSSGRNAWGLFSLVAVFFAIGTQSVARSLPFALTLGASRRTYFGGTAALAAGLAVTYGLVITVLQAVERASGGWGLSAHVFTVPYLLTGPWYLTWLTAAVILALAFTYGMWFGLVYRRWSLPGTLALGASQVTVLVAVIAVITWSHGWAGTGRFFTTLSAAGLTGLLAALTAGLLAGGYATVRRSPA